MSDLEALYLILVALYLIQCIVWVPEDSHVFRKNLRGQWRSAVGPLHVGVWRLRGALANPLPPLEGLLVCDRVPIAVSPQGVLFTSEASLRAATGASEPQSIMQFSEVQKLGVHGKHVFAGGKRFFTAHTPGVAQRAAALLERLRAKKEEKRAALIDAEFARMFDVNAIRERLTEWRSRTALLRPQCNALFACLFLVAPAVIAWRGLRGTWLWLLAPLLAQMAVIAWSFRRAHRALFPEDRETRWTATMTILLSPPVAIRAGDVLMRELLSAFHPLAVAHVLCGAEYFAELASCTLRKLAFPLPSSVPPGTSAQETAMWFRESLYRSAQRFVAACGADPQRILATPARESPECLAYCPRCCVQFRFVGGACPDCGVALRELLPDTKADSR